MNQFYTDILEQPQALRTLVDFYRHHWACLSISAVQTTPLLVGMGASFHAASIAALHLQSHKIPAFALEASDLLNYGSAVVENCNLLVYISQSGSSGEVQPVLEHLAQTTTLVAVTNTPESVLGRRAQMVLNLLAGPETLVAAKTYLNSLAVLWLLVRDWSGAWDGTEFDKLAALADSCEELLASAATLPAPWLNLFEHPEKLIFMGHGPHAMTARQAAMMASEWAKVSIFSTGIGAFRHGLIESAEPNTGVMIFAAPGPTYNSSLALAEELHTYGVPVLMTVQGKTYNVSEASTIPTSHGPCEFLAPVLDTIPAQLFVEALARQRGIEPGFRYINKIVTRL